MHTPNARKYRLNYDPMEFHEAIQRGDYQSVYRYLQKDPELAEACNADWYPVHTAAMWGNVPIFKLLLQYRARVNVRNMEYETPAHIAAAYNNTHIIQILEAHGGDLTACDIDGYTPSNLLIQWDEPD